jgi:hypothetical protein
MMKWPKRIRAAIGMGLTWAAAWAVGGILIGVASNVLPGLPWDAFFDVFDAPLPALAVPGFFGGAIFSIVLGIAGRRRKFNELSLARLAAWGALGGVLLTLLPAALVGVGLASAEGAKHSIWYATGVMILPLTLFSTLSAAGSLILARKAAVRTSPDALSENEISELTSPIPQSMRQMKSPAPSSRSQS